MSHGDEKRFEDFFQEGKYIALKNHLYNYTLRKRAIERILEHETIDLVLEVGSGISPVMTRTERIVYSELSPRALRTLKAIQGGKGWYVAADSTRLPFADGAFSHAIGSEVFEHVERDQQALDELGRVLVSGGELIVTFPHRKRYFANDDRFVNHFRRYELHEMEEKLRTAGLRPFVVRKILGPLEKATMMVTCFVASRMERDDKSAQPTARSSVFMRYVVAPVFKWCNVLYAALAALDAALVPQRLAAVLLIRSRKIGEGAQDTA